MALRKEFDVGNQSHIHMTDNTYQSLEYIDVLFPNKLNQIKKDIHKFDLKILNIIFYKIPYLYLNII